MRVYADEDIPDAVVQELRRLGHDVLTAQEDNQHGADDSQILTRAHALGRTALTHNRWHFERLNRLGMPQSGIVSATQDPTNPIALADRIHVAVAGQAPGRWHIRVNRPQVP
jgi:hypothetical protein